jgi:hypothetical protein
VTNNYNIIINPFGKEKIDHIINDYEFMKKCVRNATTHGVTDLSRRIHFDDEHPENKNIRLKSLKRELMEVMKEDNQWHLMDKSEALDKLMRKAFVALHNFYDKNLTDDDEGDFRLDLLRKIQIKYTNIYYTVCKRLNVVIMDESNRSRSAQ